MLFKDRVDAAAKLVDLLKRDETVQQLLSNKDDAIVISLLRGGIVIGEALSKAFSIKHLPLIVKKISHPRNSELAIGALCYNTTYLDPAATHQLEIDPPTINRQISETRKKFSEYQKTFGLKKDLYFSLRNKIIILTDDGVATGASIKTAALFLKTMGVKKIALAVPTAPIDFDKRGFDVVVAASLESGLGSVSQAYENFPQVENEEVLTILRNKISLNK